MAEPTLAFPGRAFAILAGMLAMTGFGAPPGASPPQNYAQVGLPNQAEGRAVIEQFRESGPGGPYYLEFQLREFPRRGPERVIPGRLWGSRNEQGAVLRIELNPGRPGEERRFLVQNGVQAAVWTYAPGGPVPEPRLAQPFEPLVPGVEITPFDLQMPFLYWPDVRLMGIERVRGLSRPAYVFLFRPPANYAGSPAGLSGVRAYLDTQYHAPVQTEVLAADGSPKTTFSLVDLKKVGEQWIPKDIEIRNETTRDKTRFSVTAAALGLDFVSNFLLPERLPEPVAPPSADRLARFDR